MQKYATTILAGFMGGIFIRSFLDFGWPLAEFFVLLGIAFIGTNVFLHLDIKFNTKHTVNESMLSPKFVNSDNHGRSASLILTVGIFLIAVGFGAGRYEMSEAGKYKSELRKYVGQNVELRGIVDDEPDERENYIRLTISTRTVLVGVSAKVRPSQDSQNQLGTTRSKLGEGNNLDEKILVYAKLFPKFKYGDEVKIVGKLQEPKMAQSSENLKNDNAGNLSNKFDWPAYLAKDGIYYEMVFPKIEVVGGGQGNWLKTKLFVLKENILSALGRVIPEPHASFMAGLTIGAKQSLPKSLMDDFKKTGVAHMVVISGYNITVIASSVMAAFAFLPQAVGLSLGMLSIALFAIMTGASATVIRAAFMAILVLLARMTGRIYTLTWALFLAAFFMVLQNPKILRFDASFQLSFLASVALIYFSPVVKDKIDKILRKIGFRPVSNFTPGVIGGGQNDKLTLWQKISNTASEIVSSTISVQFFVLPFLLYQTGLFPVYSLPVNFLILPLVPATMFFGFLTAALGMASAILSVPFGWLAPLGGGVSYVFLSYELFIVRFFAHLSFSSFTISNFPLWLMWVCYAGLGWVIWKYRKNDRTSDVLS